MKEITKKINGWKIAFLVLIGILLGSVLFATVRIFTVRETNLPPSSETTVPKGSPVLTMNTNKKKLNTVMAYFLNDLQKDSTVKYEFYLENQAMLKGEFKILGAKVEFYLYFDPYVMDNGNVQLKARDLSIGTLNLPVSQVMATVKRSYTFPKWVAIDPKDQTIVLKLNKFKLNNGMFIKANHIDLVGDDIQFGLYLPKEKTNK
ncbi:YpmS family protein [Enterococcus dongliensis]|uniref:YpmS family protein n=1 Tax=Enterococcus dongliensis TaxID=2559925 RepID=A0AAP5KPA4_9ENTE|nr:YpmS family protein [Enterococcus dongliensis]MDT2596096.1 YpmS family protein [Enterococcus dongliensis]MDT2603538.1 YpmS family protein [Enterococcus dongliensis]MDT2613779.1 YpmS family protein [Enterococcus dongliensis]MDT2635252.1 YpmS family protein [Enterococcus dongliensis]MDT2636950.1 YpmS family protein [Enterococcus dongliensis]